MRSAFTLSWLVIVPSLVVGCSSAVANRISSAGRVGCMPEEIQIAEIDSGWGGVVWKASCRGKTFVCSGSSDQVDCSELRATPAPSGEASARGPAAPTPTAAAPPPTTATTAPPPATPTAAPPAGSSLPVAAPDAEVTKRPDGTCWSTDPHACEPNTPCDPPLVRVRCPEPPKTEPDVGPTGTW